jgi:hypothetical protein
MLLLATSLSSHLVEPPHQCPEFLVGQASHQGVYVFGVRSPSQIRNIGNSTGFLSCALDVVVGYRQSMTFGSLLLKERPW